MAGLYIHIPFCKQACHYCDFHFSTNQDVKAEVIFAIAKEIKLQSGYLNGETINTIYFGGGTPSLLSSKEIDTIFNSIHSNYKIDSGAEITLEGNPDDLTFQKLKDFKEVGINRLSIGIQSFDNAVLKFLNRAHDGDSAVQCVQQSQEIGFNNISIDLIYALPGQDEAAWRKNINQALALNPQHISSYSLTIEEKTVFGKWSTKGKLKAVDDEVAATQLEMLIDELERGGFDQYEVSNFGKPGFYSRHNSNYWKEENYLGIGPSAHSYNGVSRQYNVSNNHLYVQGLKSNSIPFELEVLTREDRINEYLLTTLRTKWGCNLERIKNNFHYDIASANALYLDELYDKKLALMDGGILKLTKPGKLLADKIASDLFLLKD